MKTRVVVGTPVTRSDWYELVARLVEVEDRLGIAAWALNVEPADLTLVMLAARDIIDEEGDFFFGDSTNRLLNAVRELGLKCRWE